MNTQPLVIFVGRAYPRKIINPNCQVQVIGFVLFMYKLFLKFQDMIAWRIINVCLLGFALSGIRLNWGGTERFYWKRSTCLLTLVGESAFYIFFFFMTSSPTTSSPFQLTIEVKVFSSYCLGRLSLGRGVYIQEYAGSAMNIGIER